jgi:leucyl aminopeptidase (aminopeptidase T)
MGTIEEGAEIAVNKCMKIHSKDRVLIVADNPSKDIGMAIRTAALAVTEKVRFFNLDLPTYGGRPIMSMPSSLQEAIGRSTATFFVANAFEGELQTLRVPFLKLAMQNARHAHMVGVTKKIMETGVCVDYDEVSRITDNLFDLLTKAKEVHVTSAAGTDFTATLDPTIRWKKDNGVIDTDKEWENLPSGEIFTAPGSLEGRLVVDGTVGEWIGIKYEGKVDYQETPIDIEVEHSPEGSYLKSVKCKHKELLADFEKYLQVNRYASRVGELGFGTNIFLEELIGIILQDEKFPTVHVAFGDPYHDKTGANWSCNSHIDVLMRECNIVVDGQQIMKEGKYTEIITG